jgi:NTE family protein
MIGLALSGGGSRAIAFHLGCMRALYDRAIISKISVISTISGGSIIGAFYAYSPTLSFDEFDKRIVSLLRQGLNREILKQLFTPRIFFGILTTYLIAHPAAYLAKFIKKDPPLTRWFCITNAFENVLRKKLFGDIKLTDNRRDGIRVIINACELRTGTSFRFGDEKSGNWRFGILADNNISVAHAVACSAAYPILLPSFDCTLDFVRQGKKIRSRINLTDGGVYDNLGISCLEPGKNIAFNTHVFKSDYIISCYAGHGQFSRRSIPFNIISRTSYAFDTVFRKVQDSAMQRLHMYKRSGELKGFILSYLGQQDSSLPIVPADLVCREEIIDYPTDFAPMSETDIARISLRGEQLMRLLISHYCPEL